MTPIKLCDRSRRGGVSLITLTNIICLQGQERQTSNGFFAIYIEFLNISFLCINMVQSWYYKKVNFRIKLIMTSALNLIKFTGGVFCSK